MIQQKKQIEKDVLGWFHMSWGKHMLDWGQLGENVLQIIHGISGEYPRCSGGSGSMNKT